jgi:diguanylate cyclase (GGDEF)-like protein
MLLRSLLIIVLLMISCVSVWASYGEISEADQIKTEKNVLVLQSYHRGHDWSDDQGNAIINTLVKSDLQVSISLEYMDWKRFPDQKNLSLLHDRLKYKYENRKIDLIMTTDDAALIFALENRNEMFSDAPIVFSGVAEQDAAAILKGSSNVTGVYQMMDPKGTILAAKQMVPELKKVYIIHDKSESGISTGEMIQDAADSSGLGLTTVDLSNLTLAQLINVVSKLENGSIVFMASYNSDVSQVVYPIQDLTEKISSNSSAPIFTIDEGTFGSGTIGGSITSGTEHGIAAAELGIRILNGERADSIPISDQRSTYWGFDYLQLERFGIPAESLPDGSHLINKPFSFYETYKAFVLSNLLIILFLFAFIIFLLLNLNYRKKIQAKLENQKEAIYNLAYYSPVTGLPNRINLKDQLQTLITEDITLEHGFSLIYIDIDNFKEINDTFGHTVGDKILHSFAQRLKESAAVDDCAYCLGGDEFILLIRNHDIKAVESSVDTLIESLSNPFYAEDNTFHLSVSGGIVSCPEHGTNYIDLLKNADTAMYRSKESGKGSFTYFNQFMSDEAVQKTKMQKQLREALENGDFIMYYQPQLNAKAGTLWGFEALIRWNNPEFGFVHPMSFIRIAEESRLIIPIGDWVLETACRFIKDINEALHTEYVVSVNISVTQFIQERFVDHVLGIIGKVGLATKYIEFEITETVFLNSSKAAIEKLERLRQAGIRIALDDFGTGYSSLSYLSQLPITTLKIDKAFIKNIFESAKNMVLTNTIIRMGHAMGLELVVEGVETKAQRELFTQLGCDRLQGYLLGKPVPAQEIIRILTTEKESDKIITESALIRQ